MQKYIARRLLLYVPSLLAASMVLFIVMRVLPGDVALTILGGEESASYRQEDLLKLRELLGLNDPLVVQYGKWLWQVVTGSFGNSLDKGTPVREIIATRVPATLQLAVYVVLISMLVSVPLGVFAALFHDRWPDYVIRVVTILGLAMPSFWVALLAILGLVLLFRWVPPLIYMHLWQSPREHLELLVWPALVLAWHYSAYLTRMTRSSLLEVLKQDYIRTAYSKGLSEQTVLWRHAVRNALMPVVTLGGVYLGTLLSGTVILEAIFGIPGIGSEMVASIQHRDYPVTQALALLFMFIMLTVNLVVDLFYAWLDPRIKYS